MSGAKKVQSQWERWQFFLPFLPSLLFSEHVFISGPRLSVENQMMCVGGSHWLYSEGVPTSQKLKQSFF